MRLDVSVIQPTTWPCALIPSAAVRATPGNSILVNVRSWARNGEAARIRTEAAITLRMLRLQPERRVFMLVLPSTARAEESIPAGHCADHSPHGGERQARSDRCMLTRSPTPFRSQQTASAAARVWSVTAAYRRIIRPVQPPRTIRLASIIAGRLVACRHGKSGSTDRISTFKI
jgi:hypothetical protein